MRLSYYGGGHYDSIIEDSQDPLDALIVLPSNGKLKATNSGRLEDDEVVHRRRPRSGSNDDDEDFKRDRNEFEGTSQQFPLQRFIPGVFEDAVIARAMDRVRAAAQRRIRDGVEAAPNSEVLSTHNTLSRPADNQRGVAFDDTEEVDEEALLLALEASRKASLQADYDDLETCLAQSMKEVTHSDPSGGSASVGTAVQNGQTHPATAATGSADLIAIQGELLNSIKEQSEMEYLDRAILSSLSEEAQAQKQQQHYVEDEEEQLLEQAKRASELEYQQQQDQLEKELLRSAAGGAGTGSSQRTPTRNTAATTSSQSSSLWTPQQLSSMSENEVLELALKQSLEEKKLQSVSFNAATSASAAVTASRAGPQRYSDGDISLYEMNEDEALQMALNASLRTADAYTAAAAASAATVSSSAGGGGGQFFMSNTGDYLEEMDEELMRAIEESMKK